MSRRETWEETEAREEQDDDIYEQLLRQKDSLKGFPSFQKITIMGEQYSIRWILYYAQARMAGISCMYLSQEYANDLMFDHDDWERHGVTSRPRDMKLLWHAQQYMAKHGLYQKPK